MPKHITPTDIKPGDHVIIHKSGGNIEGTVSNAWNVGKSYPIWHLVIDTGGPYHQRFTQTLEDGWIEKVENGND